MKKLFFIWLMLELSVSQAIAQSNLPHAYEIQTDTAVSVRLDDTYWQMLEDPEGKWTIDDVNRPPIGDKFHANTTKVNGILEVDYSIHTFWLRYRLRNNMTHPARLTMPKNVTYADLYTKASDGKWDDKMTGTLLPWSKRSDLKGSTTLIYIIQPGEELLVYERDSYDYVINEPDFLDIRFGFADEVIQDYYNDNDSYILPSFIFGVFLLAALFNLYFFLIVRGRVYLYFSLVLFCRGISRFLYSNDVFFREHPLVKWYLADGCAMFYFFFLVHFVRYFFETFRYFRRWDKYLIGLSIYFLVENIFLIKKDIFPIEYSDLTGPGIVMISILITFILFLRSHVKGVRLAILAVSPAICVMAIPSLVVIFKFLNEHAGIPMPAFLKWIWVHNRVLVLEQISLLWLLIFFSWSLFQRYQQLQKTIAQEAVEKERTAKEKEIERSQFIAQRSELEMQALRAQMNPHFIFNSLNSINRFILQNNRLQASEYLTKFSKLVRMILQNSQASLITLESELESLELYLSLEALRFNYHFDYKISVPKDIDAEVLKVPPLIIQPYVENAIWHGLMHKEEKGQLDIEVSEENNFLYFKVTDNGIGRKQAAALASKSATKHKSMGLRITAHRIAMLQGSNGEESPVSINDLVEPDGTAAGTEVVIKMPVIEEA